MGSYRAFADLEESIPKSPVRRFFFMMPDNANVPAVKHL
jgi:hypothetical protein